MQLHIIYIVYTYVHIRTHTNVSISEQGKAGLSHESDRAADTSHVKLQTNHENQLQWFDEEQCQYAILEV